VNPADTVQLVLSIALPAGLAPGAHHLYFRTMGINGSWSVAERRLLYVKDIESKQITAMEYYIDNDPVRRVMPILIPSHRQIPCNSPQPYQFRVFQKASIIFTGAPAMQKGSGASSPGILLRSIPEWPHLLLHPVDLFRYVQVIPLYCKSIQ
jgi:hypothetical protein